MPTSLAMRTASATPPAHGLPWPTYMTSASRPASLSSEASACSLSALTAAAIVPFGAFALGETVYASFILFALSVLVFWTHRANIGRLIQGTEPKFGSKSKSDPKTGD